MNIKSFLVNTFYLFSGKSLTIILGMLSIMIFARAFGSQILGQLTFALSLSSIFANFSNFGTEIQIIKELAKNRKSNHFFNALIIKIAVSIIMLSLFFIYPQYAYRKFFLIIGLANILNFSTLPFRAVFQAKERFDIEAFFNVLISLLIFLITLSVVIFHYNIDFYMWAYFAINLFVFLLSIYWVSQFSKKFFDWSIDFRTIKYIIRKSAPLALSGLFSIAYFKADGILIKYLIGENALGFYAAAYKLLQSLLILPMMFSKVLFPVFSKYFATEKDRFKRISVNAYRIVSIFTVAIVIPIFVFSKTITNILYGADFAPTANVLQILIWILIFYAINNIIGNALISAEKELISVSAIIIGTVFNVLLNLLIIPKYGILGAATVALLTEFIAFIIQYSYFRKLPGRSPTLKETMQKTIHYFNLFKSKGMQKICKSSF